MAIYWLEDDLVFPHPKYADENGVLAVGGDLSSQRLLFAYQNGIFPWFNEDEPIIWWSPDPRFVLYPSKVKISKSMRKVLRDAQFQITYNQDFAAVIKNCSSVNRANQIGDGTWITQEMQQAYIDLHQLGFAHSVEVWQGGALVGGLYGVALGRCFCGESMFTKVSNASKVGFITLVQKLESLGFDMIDCQTHSNHLESLGAEYISRSSFLKYLQGNAKKPSFKGNFL
jgi:leucyl/phenylalanyl-tRNA---protein transferase